MPLLDRGPGCYAKVVLELIAPCQNLAFKRSSAFLREPSKPIEVTMSCQAMILWESSLQLRHHRQAVLPAYSIDIAARLVVRRRSHCAKYQRATGIEMPSATKAHERFFLSGHAMGLFSAGFPTGAGCALTSIRPTNRLPTSPLGAGHKATGRLHCYICNFLRVAQATLLCKSQKRLIHAPFRDFLRIATYCGSGNPARLWKGGRFCGKRLRRCMESGPKFAIIWRYLPRNMPKAASVR